MSKYENTKEMSDYYHNGFYYGQFQETKSLENMISFLKETHSSPLKPDFKWESEYKDTFDLKPNAYSYNKILLDFIFEQKIPQMLISQTGFSDLVLGDINIRKVFPGSVYMGWHRDTYKYNHEIAVGRTPPLQKIIFYPNLDAKRSLQLKVLPGSHHHVFKSKLIDKLQILFSGSKNIFSSNNNFLLFDSALFHAVPELTEKSGSIRVFFNFCHSAQLSLFKGREDLHREYLERCKTIFPLNSPPADLSI